MQPGMLSEETKAKAVGVLQGYVCAETSPGSQQSHVLPLPGHRTCRLQRIPEDGAQASLGPWKASVGAFWICFVLFWTPLLLVHLSGLGLKHRCAQQQKYTQLLQKRALTAEMCPPLSVGRISKKQVVIRWTACYIRYWGIYSCMLVQKYARKYYSAFAMRF